MIPDIRFAFRQMQRTPMTTTVALLAIAIAMGANSTVFSFFNALYFRTLAVGNSDRLVAVHRVDPMEPGRLQIITAEEYTYYRHNATTFGGLAAQAWAWTWLAHGDRSVEWQGGQVSANYFDVFGVTPLVGRFFADDHDTSSAVISHHSWTHTFDADPAVVGRTLRLNQRPFTVIGVAPPDFEGMYYGDALDVWTVDPQPEGNVVGVLAPGVSIDAARAELATLSRHFAQDARRDRGQSHVVANRLKGVHPDSRDALAYLPVLLATATGCLLAIACANLAGLLLARADARRREIALRVSLGASRRRVVRQLLTESILLSVGGGAIGLWLATFGGRLLERFFGYSISGVQLVVDWRIVAVSAVVSVGTGLIFGLVPAWHATRPDLNTAMRERSSVGVVAIAVQIALSAVLLIGAGLLFQSMQSVLVRPGIDPERVAHFRLRPSRLGYTLDRARTYHRELIRRLEATPGVDRAVLARVPPERGWCCDIDVSRPGEEPTRVAQNEVAPGFLLAMSIPLVEGRDFTETDRDVAIISQSLAARLWPNQRALGNEIWIDREPHRVIGMAGDIFAVRAGESSYPYVYLPMWGRNVTDPRLFVRVHGNAAGMIEPLRRVIVSVDPEVHVGQESSLAARTEMSYQQERLLAALLEFTSLVALWLSAIGVYGLVSYRITRRTREIGIRMALGAESRSVAAWILRQSVFATGAGLAAGVALALPATQLLTRFLYGVEPVDVTTFAVAIGILTVISLIACLIPVLRIGRIDPAVTLRAGD
jgi:predicted permease